MVISKNNLKLYFLFSLVTVLFCGCGTIIKELQETVNALSDEESQTAGGGGPVVKVKTNDLPVFVDDMDYRSLNRAADYSRNLISRTKQITYGSETYANDEIVDTIDELSRIIETNKDQKTIDKLIKQKFNVYKSIGRTGKGDAFFTGYYSPTYRGSMTKSEIYKYPLYSLPSDIATRNPYYTREEIDTKKVLEGKGLELVWLESLIDVFFLQVQGSGMVQLDTGKGFQVNYAGNNGYEYKSIGRLLINENKIPEDQMSMQAICNYLIQHPEEMNRIFNYNPRYIFFNGKETDSGEFSTQLTAGRSVAADLSFFPKGLLAYIVTEKPVISDQGQIINWEKFGRFVFINDTGSAIKGPGRIDIYCGADKKAEITAGHLKHQGELYFLAKKK